MNSARASDRWRAIFIALLLIAACSDTNVNRLPDVPGVDTGEMQPAVREQIERARQAIVDDPTDPNANSQFAKLLQAYALNHAADAAWTRTRNLDDGRFAWSYLHGLVLTRLSKPNEAAAAFRHTLSLRADDVRALIGLAAALSDSGDLEKSIKTYRQALAIDSGQLDARFALAEQLVKNGEVDSAINELTSLTGGNQEYGPVHYALASAYRRQGDSGAAARHTSLFQQYKDNKLPVTDALQLAIQALRVSDQPLLDKAAAFFQAGNLSQAAVVYQAALTINPDNATTHANLAGILGELGKTDQAQAHFERAIALNPNLTIAYSNIGTVYLKAKRIDEAQRAFARVLVLDPRDASAQARFGYTLELQSRIDEAQDAYRSALESDPNEPFANFLIGKYIATTESCVAAVPYLERSIVGDENSSTALYLLGLVQCYGQMARLDEALGAARRGERLATRYGQQVILSRLQEMSKSLGEQRAPTGN